LGKRSRFAVPSETYSTGSRANSASATETTSSASPEQKTTRPQIASASSTKRTPSVAVSDVRRDENVASVDALPR
jgi:hypothetical protein